ncbi:unnamed protein product [Closterium sp. NIES-54]
MPLRCCPALPARYRAAYCARPPAACAARLLLAPPACCPHTGRALPARQRALLPTAPARPAAQHASAPARPAAQRASAPRCPARHRAPLPNAPVRPRFPARQRALLPSAPARPAALRASVPCCPARQRALLPSVPARPAAQRPARPAAQRLVPCPARAVRACPARAQVLPAAAALGAAACCCRPRCYHLLLHTLLPTCSRSCPAPRAPPTAAAASATAIAPTTAAIAPTVLATATAVVTSPLALLLLTDTAYHGHYYCPTPGGGASRACRQKPLSPQQRREWAVWWGSPGAGACGATNGGTCESTPASSAAGRRGGSGGGQQLQQRLPETLSLQQLHEWAVRWGSPGGGGFWSTCTGGVEAPGAIEAAILGAFDSASTGAEPEEALHTFTLDSGASRCFFRDSTTVTPLTVPVPVTLADPSGGPVVTRGATVLPCPAAPSGLLTGLHLPSFAKNLVATSVLQDQWVTVTQLGGELVAICTDSRTGEHLATFTQRPGSGMYIVTTKSALVAESGQVAALVEVAASCLCRLTHQTLLWHHRLGYPSLPRLRGMSGLPRSMPLLPRSFALPCLPCVEGRQRAAPHSSSFPPTTAPL